jgi:hypothetical protein
MPFIGAIAGPLAAGLASAGPAIGGLASAGAGIASAVTGSKGGGQTPNAGLDPRNALAYELLGQGQFGFGPKGKRFKRLGDSRFNAFGPQTMHEIIDFINNPVRRNQYELGATDFMDAIPGMNEARNQFFAENIVPTLEALTSTGLRTDTEGIKSAAREGFQEETVPGAMEHFGGDFGLRGTHTSNVLGQLGRGLERDLAGLDFEADEAATQRRMQAQSLAANLFNQNIIQNAALGENMLGFGARVRQGEESVRPGGRSFNSLMTLMGETSPSTPYMQGYSPSGFSQIASSVGDIGSGLGSVAGSLADIFGKGN